MVPKREHHAVTLEKCVMGEFLKGNVTNFINIDLFQIYICVLEKMRLQLRVGKPHGKELFWREA
jgi:hypothetical protein